MAGLGLALPFFLRCRNYSKTFTSSCSSAYFIFFLLVSLDLDFFGFLDLLDLDFFDFFDFFVLLGIYPSVDFP